MKIFLVLLFIWVLAPAVAQKKIKTLTLSDTILYAATDRPGDFYAITTTGQIQRFDKDGKLTLLYKAEKAPTLFDPRDGARLFAYYRHDQHYEFLSPSFQPTGSYKVDPAFAIQPWLICPAGEYKLWILDKADHSLKKINVKASEVEVEVVVDSALIENATTFKTMREYQSFVFLLNPAKGIFIFNNLGKHIKTIGLPGIMSFNFLGEELYYLHGDTIELFNLFTAETRQIQISKGFTDALLTDERMILFTPASIDIYPFRP
ncbi:MAG: hypothetical protein WD824_03895 [Cyclobacteriaceae bacterium]